MPKRKRAQREHTEDWQTIQQYTLWPEQEVYERLRPVVLFGETAAERAKEIGASERTLHHLADQRQADEAAAASAQSSAYHADQRYDAGVADYVEVTTTHTAALNAQRDTISVRVAQMNTAVALVRATGGGWTQDQLDHPVMP